MAQQEGGSDPREALLDGTERVLAGAGHGAVSTRRVAEEAGVNHGLVHYYFGSMENLLVAALDRFAKRLIDRHRAMYGQGAPFLRKWRAAMSDLTGGLDPADQKVWLELHAMAWNRPALRERVALVTAERRAVLTEAVEQAKREYGLEDDVFPTEALVALVEAFNLGVMLERQAGVGAGHRVVVDTIDLWLELLEEGSLR